MFQHYPNPVEKALRSASATNALEGVFMTLPELQARKRAISGELTLDELRDTWLTLPAYEPSEQEMALRELYVKGDITIAELEDRVLALAA